MKPDKLNAPFVSVIVPVFNDEIRVKKCIQKLIDQSYPGTCYEVIVVDNSSSDGSVKAIRQFPVKLLFEKGKQSSYAARNKGLRYARGDIIAFTDSDCAPVRNWITEGVTAMEQKQCDMIGGNVRFEFSSSPSGAEIYDSMTNMQIEINISRRQVAKTANLFVRRQVVEKIGPFPENVKSGGDVYWTRKATQRGFSIEFAPDAEVVHPSRKLMALLKKQYRVGKGQVFIWNDSGAPLKEFIRQIVKNSKPPIFCFMIGKRPLQTVQLSIIGVTRLFFAAWLCRLVTLAGIIKGSLSSIQLKKLSSHAVE